jgi:hypothetical protein
MTYFYFGDNALNPTLLNVDQVTTFDNSTGTTSFTTPSLNAYTYYPILVYYGQSFGGAYLTVGLISPNETTANYSPTAFVTSNPSACFLEGSTILCKDENGSIKYLPIETLYPGILVKTYSHGFLPIDMIGTSQLYPNFNDDKQIKDRLYKCPKENFPELSDDLIITGSHSILVDKLTEWQWILTKKTLGDIYVTDNKFRLMAFLDPKTIPYKHTQKVNIWHLALQNNNYYSNYGVYANGGLLVETCSKRYLKELSGMTLILSSNH